MQNKLLIINISIASAFAVHGVIANPAGIKSQVRITSICNCLIRSSTL